MAEAKKHTHVFAEGEGLTAQMEIGVQKGADEKMYACVAVSFERTMEPFALSVIRAAQEQPAVYLDFDGERAHVVAYFRVSPVPPEMVEAYRRIALKNAPVEFGNKVHELTIASQGFYSMSKFADFFDLYQRERRFALEVVAAQSQGCERLWSTTLDELKPGGPYDHIRPGL